MLPKRNPVVLGFQLGPQGTLVPHLCLTVLFILLFFLAPYANCCVPPVLSLRPGSREGAIKNLQLPIVVKVPKKHIMMIEVYKFTARTGRRNYGHYYNIFIGKFLIR